MEIERPSGKLWRARLTVLLPVATALVVAALTAVDGVAAAVAVLTAGAAATACATWVLRQRVLSWEYVRREDDLLVQRGVLFRRMTVVPYGRMQLVDVVAGPVDRIYGLATVRLHTAAAASDARIPGLDGDAAAALRDDLARRGEARAAGL